MGIRSFEAEILKELRLVAKNSKIRQKDIMEWSTGKVTPRDCETLYHLPNTGVNVAVKINATPLSF